MANAVGSFRRQQRFVLTADTILEVAEMDATLVFIAIPKTDVITVTNMKASAPDIAIGITNSDNFLNNGSKTFMDAYSKNKIAGLTPAAERGDKVAMFRLAETYACVWDYGISEQEWIDCASKALRWLQASADANYLPAVLEFARIYENPLGDIRYRIFQGNMELARKYRMKAAKLRGT